MIDLIVCLGGDGTLLYTASLFQQNVPPVMAFNMGSLGFLTPLEIGNFKQQINHVLEGNKYNLKARSTGWFIISDQCNDGGAMAQQFLMFVFRLCQPDPQSPPTVHYHQEAGQGSHRVNGIFWDRRQNG